MTDKQLLTPDEAVAYLKGLGRKTSAHTIRKAIKAGQFPGHRIGCRYVIPLIELERKFEGKDAPVSEPTPLNATVHRFIARKSA